MGLWIIAAFVSAFIKGLCGVGDAPVFSAILAFTNNNIDIAPVSLLTSLPSNIYLIWKNRKSLVRRVWMPLSLLVIAGSVPGILLLKNTDTRVLKTYFGFFIILVGILLLVNELSPQKRQPSKVLLAAVGILAGITSGLFGIGIFLVVYFSLTTNNLNEFKGNICAVFAAENTVRLILYIFLGICNAESLKRAAIVLPFVMLGIFIGSKSAAFLDERKAKIVIMITLIISGAAIAITNL